MNEKPEASDVLQREPSGNFDNGGAVLLLQSKDAKLRHQHAEIERLMKEVVSLTAIRDRQASMLRRLEEREAELDAEIGRLTKENARLREALESIAANACCDRCQEAALVAKAALRRES